MFGILKALLRIGREVQRIREIHEIVYKSELEYHDLVTKSAKSPPLKPSEVEFTVTPYIQRDEFGQIIEPSTEDE